MLCIWWCMKIAINFEVMLDSNAINAQVYANQLKYKKMLMKYNFYLLSASKKLM